MDFPQYRKLSNCKSYYRVNDEKCFDEIQLIGDKAIHFFIEAKQYPEMLRIKDMLEYQFEGLEASSQEEFEMLLERCS